MPAPIINVKTQFPYFDNIAMFYKILENVPGSRDVSWQYDTSPCIKSPGAEIWIENLSIERRESESFLTFTICQIDERDEETGLVIETDSVSEAIFIAKYFKTQENQLSLVFE